PTQPSSWAGWSPTTAGSTDRAPSSGRGRGSRSCWRDPRERAPPASRSSGGRAPEDAPAEGDERERDQHEHAEQEAEPADAAEHPAHAMAVVAEGVAGGEKHGAEDGGRKHRLGDRGGERLHVRLLVELTLSTVGSRASGVIGARADSDRPP